MGTVGLSFGSPTSGAGFNVSATVAEIVSNLQNVETPWQNQLTALESQDSAISNLGTLFSNLSNDISSLTDLQGVLAQKEGSSSDTNVLELTAATSAAEAGAHTVVVKNLAQTSSGYLDEIAEASDALSGSISIQVGSGTTENVAIGAAPSPPAANTIYTGSGQDTLADLASAINSANLGVTANVLTDTSGSQLSIVSDTSGAAGQLNITSSLTDTNTTDALSFHTPVNGVDASMVIDGVTLTSASNTVTNLIPGVTFQLLAPSATESDDSLEQVQVVIGNDNTAVESTVNQFVSDYNALISAVNVQEGDTSSGTPEPLFGSPTLTLLQQELLGSLTTENPNGSLASVTNDLNPTLSGSISIQVGGGTAQTITLSPSQTSLSALAQAINSADIGVTAGVATSNGQSTLSLTSQTAGSAGALGVDSDIVAASNIPLTYTGTNATSSEPSQGTLTSIPSASDTLTGSIAVQVGAAAPQTIQMSTVASTEGAATLADLQEYISNNSSVLGISASLVTNGDGSQSLSLVSNTSGKSGNLHVTSNLIDTTSTANATLTYTNSSDINTLTSLGISENNDGSLTFDANTLDSVLNSDYNSVVGFFQNATSWGQNFSTMLTNAGTSSSTGALALAQNANSSMESTLNAEISKEQSYISAQQSSLTTELNEANQILQQLPNQLDEMNELYSAITGYDQNLNG